MGCQPRTVDVDVSGARRQTGRRVLQMKLWHVAAKAIVVALVALLLHLTSDPFTMVQGSNFTSFVIGPVLTVQIACLAVLAVALVIRTRPAFSVARWAVALCAVLMASHRLVIDNLDHQIRDVYV